MPAHSSYDAVIVGGGHNGLVAAAYLARAGRRVLLLERLAHTGGAAVSATAFPGVAARLSRYAYLVSLLPDHIVRDLGLRLTPAKREFSSYTPVVRQGRATGLLVGGGTERTREAFARLTGSDREFEAWQDFYAMTRRLAARVFPSLTEPLPTRAELRERVGDEAAWEAVFERPLGETIEERFADDLVRGVVLTDGLIGTFASAHDPSLRQNRCFLYHVIGGSTGDWDVPVGGMGAVTDALAASARRAGAELVTGHEVTGISPDGGPGGRAEVRFADGEGRDGAVGAERVLVNASPQVLARLLGEAAGQPSEPVEGAQLKVNMLLRRLPRLRDASVDPRDAFAGTFHVAEGYAQLETAYREAVAGTGPAAPPSELYCHSLSDPSILSPELAGAGYQTLTLFGLHTPARLFAGGGQSEAEVRDRLLAAALAQLDEQLAEPIADCLAVDGEGRPCLEVKTPLDLERDLWLPGGNIFHGDLDFPFREGADGARGPADRWGVGTGHERVLVCGSGAARGGGVSGIPGHNAAMAALGR
ncbi:FAD-dependent pyridine nucleotide-disulfide oxidoreductase [Streptomyces xiamenensis]|uniref:Pyridine nucleotide-disulfide oxidoreductase domain-containing protein 2 n=1 Tax=Streptomyces xiamenensis TaxID=408015 RepID=A0A0F7FNJ3_9ACTN|nr:NAD(P)/FAD-dependent oxidoreductase [Streptomyces xiamenensis]AKG41502.1 FAD-dependent pyridine nucleotide-disulfide oxidoreductase [Streptomyces xiamenensis]